MFVKLNPRSPSAVETGDFFSIIYDQHCFTYRSFICFVIHNRKYIYLKLYVSIFLSFLYAF